MRKDPSSHAMLTLYERRDEEADLLVSEFQVARHGRCPWRVVSAARLERIWKDAAREGFVRNEKGLEAICDRMVTNALRLSINTVLAEHSVEPRSSILEDRLEEGEWDAFVSWAIDIDDTGWRWRISDGGSEPLFRLAALLLETADSLDRLVVIDRMLNVAHPRSDLASWFVEGGCATLDGLSEARLPTGEGSAPTSAAVP